MAPYLFWEFIILIIGVWLMVALFVVYGWLLLKRQKQMMQAFFKPTFMSSHGEEETASTVHLEISKDEPIAKYKNLTEEDQLDVSFVDKNE